MTYLFNIADGKKKKKVLMVPNDPSVSSENVPQISKNATKKEKLKRLRQEMAKPLAPELDPSKEKVLIKLASG